jgi:hypothetical protein
MTADLAAERRPGQRVSEKQPDSGLWIVLGLLPAGCGANGLAAGLGNALENQMVRQHTSVRWSLKVHNLRLVPLPGEASEAIETTRRRMPAGGWHLAVLVTDLPLMEGDRSVLGEVISPTHRVAMISQRFG